MDQADKPFLAEFRGFFVSVALIAVAAGGLVMTDPELPDNFVTVQNETIKQDVRDNASAADIDARVNTALSEDDYETAVIYAELAQWVGYEMTPETVQRLEAAGSWTQSIWRGTQDFFGGAYSGEADSIPGLSGVVAADLTVIGDIRDVNREGRKLVAGEDYDELILGLSVVGIGVTTATLATAGTTLSGRVGVSVTKVAKKTGALTTEFSGVMRRQVGDAVNFQGLRRTLSSTDLTDAPAVRRSVGQFASSVRGADLFPTLNRMNTLSNNTNVGEAVRLMRYVRSTDNLDDMARLSQRTGVRTRAVVETTGKTGLRGFKTTTKVLEWIAQNIYEFIAAIGSFLLVTLRRVGMRMLRLFAR